jgi:hypothetical protein
MASGISLHIGLNSVDATHYQGWSGRLKACEADAQSMQQIAHDRGLAAQTLLTAAAKADAVKQAIQDAATRARTGDLFFLTYSGHGGQVPDRNGDDRDHLDETWVLYDRELVDDELYALWGRFQPGVRIFVLSDSCHSGSVVRDIAEAVVPQIVDHGLVDTDEPTFKDLPAEVARNTYAANKSLYDSIQQEVPSNVKARVAATVILISGCQDNQLSLDGKKNGLFTQHLLEVWSKGQWRGPHLRFQQAIGARMPPTQTPNYFTTGARDAAFEQQTPLTV